MLIKKSEIIDLSENIRRAIDGEQVDLRDNREGAFSILKNDIHTLVAIKDEQANLAQTKQENLSKYLEDISHQLKTPVTSMGIMADLLEDAPPERQQEFISHIKISLNRMEWLVASLLKMAKLDSDTVSFVRTEVAVSELLRLATEPLKILVDCGENPIYQWISVTDMGQGISREEMKKLFVRFEGSKNANGYGIGLPLARSMPIQRMCV